MKILDIRKIRDELLDSINGAYTNNKYFFVFIQENNEIGKRYFNTLKKLSKKYNVNIVGFFYKNNVFSLESQLFLSDIFHPLPSSLP